MTEVEGLAWSRQVMGEAGPHVRAVAPRVLAATHSTLAAKHVELDLGTAAVYGLMYLAVPRALLRELDVAEVRPFRPRGAPYQVPIINGVPLVAWRYAKDRTTDIDQVLFGHPVSDTRRSLFSPLDLPLQLELGLGEAGLGDDVLAELPAEQQDELDRYIGMIRELAADGRRIAVLGYASNPDALLRGYLGYAELGSDDRLVWAFREELQLPTNLAAEAPAASPMAVVTEDAFDSGPVDSPRLRPRTTRETGESDTP